MSYQTDVIVLCGFGLRTNGDSVGRVEDYANPNSPLQIH